MLSWEHDDVVNAALAITKQALGEGHPSEYRGVEPRWDMNDGTVSCNGWVYHGTINCIVKAKH